MQPKKSRLTTPHHRPFQYPRSDRRRCNLWTGAGALSGSSLSVSSVGSEAMQPSGGEQCTCTVSFFQYPRSDRRRCNLGGGFGPAPLARLSVSSVGSEAMQLRKLFGYKPVPSAFSILGRIGGDATRAGNAAGGGGPPFSILGRIGGDATLPNPCAGCHYFPALSVSSVGSGAMQHSAVVGRADLEVKLSVSSVGSEAMQLALAVRFARGIFVFQYPRSDRRRCNDDDLIPGGLGELPFQYPRSDWRRCNADDQDAIRQWDNPFSILGRIRGDATQSRYAKRPRSGLRLSVSSVGSEAMQQEIDIGEECPVQRFQYPRSDRRRCNRWVCDHPIPRPERFQYPRSDRRRCNGYDVSHPDLPDMSFQYPRSDRRRCNHLGLLTVLAKNVPFSILGRIGGDATMGPAKRRVIRPVCFQYPRSDRRRCNEAIRSEILYWLSAPFSILGRIGGDATTRAPNAEGAG